MRRMRRGGGNHLLSERRGETVRKASVALWVLFGLMTLAGSTTPVLAETTSGSQSSMSAEDLAALITARASADSGTPPTTATAGPASASASASAVSQADTSALISTGEAAVAASEALLAQPVRADNETINRTIRSLEALRGELQAACPLACHALIERIDQSIAALRDQLAAPAHIEYVALGDSYAAGEGNGPFPTHQAFSDVFFGSGGVTQSDFCHRSALSSYPTILGNLLRSDLVVDTFTTFACTGATSLNILEDEQAPGGRSVPLVPEQVAALNEQVDLVTMTVGINDLGAIFQGEKKNPTDPDAGASKAIADCILFNCADNVFFKGFGLQETTDIGAFALRVSPPGKDTDLITPRLQSLFAEMQDRIGSQTKVFVMGYPHFFADSAAGTNASCSEAGIRIRGDFTYTERRGVRGRPDVITPGIPGRIDIMPQLAGDERRAINRGLDALNTLIATSLPSDPRFTFVSVNNALRNDELLCGSSRTRALHPLSLITINLPKIDVGTFNAPGTIPPPLCTFNDFGRAFVGLLSGVSLNCQQLAYLQKSAPSIDSFLKGNVNPAPLHPTRRGQEGLATTLAARINSTLRPTPGLRLTPPALKPIGSECPDTFIVTWTDRSVGETSFNIYDTIFGDLKAVPINPGPNTREVSNRYDAGGLAGSHHVFSVTAVGQNSESVNSNRQLASRNCLG